MNDAEFAVEMGRLATLTMRWVPPLGLGWWNIEQVYVREASEFLVSGEPAPHTAASTNADWRYGDAIIKWNMTLLARHDDVELERMFVHELMHIFLCEMRCPDGVEDHEERVATTLGKAFMWLREDIEHAAEVRVQQEGDLGQHPNGNAPREAAEASRSNRLQQGGKGTQEWQRQVRVAPPHVVFPSSPRP